MTTKTTRPLFEHVTCSRCAGSGSYSWNAMNGSRCFGCGGSGFTLTKRGRVAQAFLNKMRKIPAEAFAVGDWILSEGVPGFSASVWLRVTEVTHGKAGDFGYITFTDIPAVKIVAVDKEGGTGSFVGYSGSTEYRKGFTNEEKAEQRRLALAYQDTLTKAGTVRASAAKAALFAAIEIPLACPTE